MSQEVLEERVGKLETEQVRQGARLDELVRDVGKIGSGVEKLLDREAKRPPALTWATIGGTAAALVSIALVGWWLISSSPAIQDLRDRVSRLDDPEVGKVRRLEERTRELETWRPTVYRN